MPKDDTAYYLKIIAGIADAFGISVAEMRGHCRQVRLVDARAAAAKALRCEDLTFVAIGKLLNRDSTSVRGLLKRRIGPSAVARKVKPTTAAPRDETERQFNRMCKAGSRALAAAIFATGRMHGPMSEEAQAAAVAWSKDGPKFTAIGWM